MGSRRSNGEGTEIKLGADERWHASLSFGIKPGGKRDRRHVSGKTRAEVALKIRNLQTKRDAGLVPTTGKTPTLAEWLRHWLDTIAAPSVRPRTLYDYRQIIEVRIIPALGHHRLDRLQPEHVEMFYAECMRPADPARLKNGAQRRAEGQSASTVLKTHRVLSRALAVAVKRERVARNVCTLVEPPSVVRDEVSPLTADEAKCLLNAAKDARNGARWSVALALGLRQGEALGLLWEDVDLDAGTVTVRRSLERRTYTHGCASAPCGAKRGADCPQRSQGGLILGEPKSRSARRTIALPSPVLAALRAHRARQTEERLAAGSMWEDRGHVFATETGAPIDPRRDWDDWKALLKLAGVRDARLHDARHTAATLLLTQGVHPRVAMQILGHSQISLTLNTYSHVPKEVSRDAMDLVGQALWDTEEVPTVEIGNQVGTGDASPDSDSESRSPDDSGAGTLSHLSDSNRRPTHYECVALAS